MDIKPMLAGKPDTDADIRFPVLASPKIDGVRALVQHGRLLSRSLKLIPNKFIQSVLTAPEFEGLDGELIVGSATDKNAMQNTTSGVMSHDKVGEFQYHVFDKFNHAGTFTDRYTLAVIQVERIQANWLNIKTKARLNGADAAIMTMPCPVIHVPHVYLDTLDSLNAYEAKRLTEGWEGVMVRDPLGKYKAGRSTVREGGLLKLKRFTDGEFIITGFEEEMENTNAKATNELGRSKRSSHAAGKVGKETLGAFIGRKLIVDEAGYIIPGELFSCGTGMTAEFRAWAWERREHLLNMVGKFKYFNHGVKDAPRHPVWVGFRDEMDMS